MSSSSLSESDYEECYKYCNESYQGTRFASTYRNPFYPTMGHPLIYYAQMPPGNRRQRSKNSNPNCFVKAFRWYTQDHVPTKRNESTDMPGFAHWLDTKYDEFVKSSQGEQNSYKLKIKQTSTVVATKKPTMTLCSDCATTKSTANKSHGKKTPSLNQYCDIKEKELQSFEYIMQPKDLIRPASECCHLTSTSCCDRSNATITSTDTREKKHKVKSRSLSSIRQDNREPIDLLTVREGRVRSKRAHRQRKNKSGSKMSTSKESSRSDTAKKSSLKKSYHDGFCQCPEQKITNVDVATQCKDTTSTQAINFICQKCAACCSRTAQNSKIALQVQNKGATKQFTNMYVPTKKDVSIKTSNTLSENSEEKVIAIVKADVKYRCSHSNTCYNCSKRDVKTESKTQYQKNCSICQQTDEIRGTILKVSSNSSVSMKHQSSSIAKDSERCCRIHDHDAVQTSDHSIHLEKETGQDYPLFMKIICADKLNEEHTLCKCTS